MLENCMHGNYVLIIFFAKMTLFRVMENCFVFFTTSMEIISEERLHNKGFDDKNEIYV